MEQRTDHSKGAKVDDAVLARVRQGMNGLRVPDMGTPVLKDECVYCFDTPFADCGIFVNLSTFVGMSADYVALDSQRTANTLYLHQKFIQMPKRVAVSEKSLEGEPLGDPFDVMRVNSLFVVTDGRPILVNLPDPALPELVSSVCDAIIKHPGMRAIQASDSLFAHSELFESKYARGLPQLDNGKRISNDPSAWRDEATGDTHNLWLNLSTGYIGGGRKNWDGSGGSGSALQHYEDTGRRYPLCAKLGTITASGADVWSYAADEDCMVLDPELARHLSHWGIDVMQLQRTDKSLIEMELEANLKFDWSKIVDGDETLTPVSGPGLKGLKNLGSSCYMNSVLQCFAAMPELQSRYKDIPIATLVSVPSPEADLGVQISKLLRALYSDRYAEEAPGSLPYTPEKYTLTPTMLKAIVGRGHREFGGSRQQDASEFFQHFLELLTRYEREGLQRLGLTGPRTARLFQFELEECLRSEATGQVRYRSGAQTLQTLLELRIPLTGTADEDGKDNDTEQDAKKARVEEVSFQSCVADYFRGSTVEFRHPNPVVGADKGQQWLRMKTFPKYLMMKLGRYYVDSAWRQVKVGAKVAVPELLDLREMRASGLQPGETPMEEAADTSVPKADAGVVAQLMSMGFSENGSTRAALACGGDPEAAVAWVFEHIEDADFNDPVHTATPTAAPEPKFSQDELMMLVSFGYTKEHATAAMLATDGDVERAADWLFSHESDLAQAVSEVTGANPNAADAVDDGVGVYSLLAVITHLGKSTDHGHYVCHIRRGDAWVLYNDDKVCVPRTVPLEHGFMYLYVRVDGDLEKLYT